jgi:hypothetical protein
MNKKENKRKHFLQKLAKKHCKPVVVDLCNDELQHKRKYNHPIVSKIVSSGKLKQPYKIPKQSADNTIKDNWKKYGQLLNDFTVETQADGTVKLVQRKTNSVVTVSDKSVNNKQIEISE